MGRPGAVDKEETSPIAMIHNECSSESSGNPSCNLPPGLEGPRCTSTIYVGDTKCESILDTGSQITTISETFHSSTCQNYLFNPYTIFSR